LKLRSALDCLLQHRTFEYLFICDDDTFVHPRRWIKHEPTGDLECRVYRPEDVTRNGGQPWIHGGPGWWMSRRMCELYVEHCHERTSADDIVAANIAREHGVEMVDRPDLYGGDSYSGHDPPQRVAADNALITCHHVQPAEMHTLYEATSGL
jgi:hypothetical protein